jgi:uncharacterized protein YndB with AHSA1/START domain
MPVGRTKDAGWEIGVSRTFPCDLDHAWRVLTSPRALRTWLGSGSLPTGERLRSMRPLDRVRLTWRPPGADHDTVLQVSVSVSRARKGGTVVNFHQEHLADAAEREAMRARWKAVVDELVPLFAPQRRTTAPRPPASCAGRPIAATSGR